MEGEIFEDDVDDYTPLQRPAEPVPAHQAMADDDSDLSAEDSESDDSDDPQRGQKKMKLKPNMLPTMPSDKTKKYSVWCTGIQEDILTEEMIASCEVEHRQFERNRDVESYDYLSHRTPAEEEGGGSSPPQSNKRQFDERHNKGTRARLGRRRNTDDNVRGAPREMLALTVTVDSSDEEVARDVANKLGEEKEDLIIRVVQVLGKAKAIELFERTKEIEEGGGMLVMNQTRRRTPGGVFLFYVKRESNQEENQKIFVEDRRHFEALKRIERSKKRRAKAQQIHRSLEEANLLTMPSDPHADPLSGEDEEAGGSKNPPPSPVTDGRADSSPEACPLPQHLAAVAQQEPPVPERTLTAYDDFLDASYEMDNMDVF